MDEIYLNGSFIARSQAQISIMDRGFLFGDGVYELIPVFNKNKTGGVYTPPVLFYQF